MKKRTFIIGMLAMLALALTSLPHAASATAMDSAHYTVERHDYSWYDTDGTLKLKHYYDNVVLQENTAAAKLINQSLQQRCDKFSAEAPSYVSDAKNDPPRFEGQYYRYYFEPTVTKNADGIFSVKEEWFWNWGGVNNQGIEGFTYDLNTGKKLNAAGVLMMSNGDAERYLKNQTLSYIYSHPNGLWWDESVAKINNYKLNDFNFYVNGNNLVVVYDQYELAPGAMGYISVNCPITNKRISVSLDGEKLSFDQQPIMDNNRVMVPIRAIFEALDYNVSWDKSSQTGTASNGSNTIRVQVGNAKITYNGGTYWCDVAPKNLSGRILVPIRAIAESAGCTVNWDQNTHTVNISTK
ncbi:MAG: stalk domain-containing protein [Peptococcaceae bacterium]|nr:stalk domain-containing protein [Peptococcaceae bacterium]